MADEAAPMAVTAKKAVWNRGGGCAARIPSSEEPSAATAAAPLAQRALCRFSAGQDRAGVWIAAGSGGIGDHDLGEAMRAGDDSAGIVVVLEVGNDELVGDLAAQGIGEQRLDAAAGFESSSGGRSAPPGASTPLLNFLLRCPRYRTVRVA